MALTIDEVRRLPKVALHDHLDGGLRPTTVIEHCAEAGHILPTTEPGTLGEWFFEAASSGDLVTYLSTFPHTIAAMQTRPHLERVAREFVLDQAADGVVYAEARWAPEQHVQQGLTEAQAVEAVRDGLAVGMAEAAAGGRPIIARQLLTSMRHGTPTTRIAELAVKYREDGVAGFDLAGAELGFPPENFLEAFRYLKGENAYFTIHAGEVRWLPSLFGAVQLCGANRLGHGVRIIEDIARSEDGTEQLGRLASYVRNQRIPLEVCVTSNLQTGVAATVAEHPIGRLFELGFTVTVSCDNRLMSGTSLSREFALLSEAFGWGIDVIEALTLNAARSAFLDHDQREALIKDVILPGFASAPGRAR